MKKWWAIGFAAYGYVLVVWCELYGLWPIPEGLVGDFICATSLTLVHVTTATRSDTVILVLLFLAPISALLYAALGFLVGKVIQKFKTASNRARSS